MGTKTMAKVGLLTSAILVGLMAAGCGKPESKKSTTVGSPPTSIASSTIPAASVDPNAPQSETPTNSSLSAQTMRDVMAELYKLGVADPASRDELLEDLQRTDPKMWPLVMKQFRETIAYRHPSSNAPTTMPAAHPLPAPAARLPQAPAQLSASRPNGAASPAQPAVGQPVPSGLKPLQNGLAGDASPKPLPDAVRRLPLVTNAVLPPVDPPQGDYPSTALSAAPLLPSKPAPQQEPLPQKPAASDNLRDVVQTAYLAEPLAGDWPQRLASTISTMERAMPANPMTPSDRVLYARLQLLYLAAGRNAEALQALPASSSTAQQSWNNMMTGLAAWLDIDRIPSDSCRDAESQHWLAKAVAKLSESAPLAIHNIAFCTEVKGFGNIKRCEKNEFTPNQEVLLYAEIENFLSESTPKGFHTSLQSNYEIVDASGQGVVTKQVFPPTEEDCQSIRRDFFIGYRVRLPKHMAPGQYVLQLTIEDLKAHKIGQTPIEFAVKDESKKKGWLGLPSLP